MKKILYKRLLLIVLAVLLIILVIVFLKRNKSFEIEYLKDGYNITETYNKEKKLYIFNISNSDKNYNTTISSKKGLKKVINSIETVGNNSEICIKINGELDFMPLCSKDNNSVDISLISEEIKNKVSYENKESKDTKKIDDIVYNSNIENTILWKYKGFYYPKNNELKYQKLFDKDIYNAVIIGTINQYLLIADYNEEYYYDNVYLFDLEKESLSTWSLDYSISFDSYILGSFDKSIYIVDKKEKKEYELVPHKKKIRMVGSESKQGIIYKNGFESISINKLTNENNYFTYDDIYQFTINNSSLYLNINDKGNMLLSNKEVDKILFSNEDKVYYLVDDEVYLYDQINKETFVLKWSELRFNNDHMVLFN